MHKKFIILPILLTAACSQQPAPFDVYGTRYYGKNGLTGVNDSTGYSQPEYSQKPIYNTSASGAGDDYNSRIDAENSTRVISRPLTVNKNNSVRTNNEGEIYSHQQYDDSGISSRPIDALPIDGDQQAVRVGASRGGLIHSGGSMVNSNTESVYDNSARALPPVEETVPSLEKSDNLINPPAANAEKKAANNLSKIKPLPKPKFQEDKDEEEVAAASTLVEKQEKPKITAKVQKVETDLEESTAADADEAPEKPAVKPLAATKNAPTPEIKPVIAKVAEVKNTESKAVVESSDGTAADADEEIPVAGAESQEPVENKISMETKTPEKVVEKEVEKTVEKTAEKTAEKPVAKTGVKFIKPVDGVVVSEFGNDKNGTGFNDGISIQAPEGTPVKAASGGTVVYSGNQLQGYGNMIIIRHPNGFLSAYSHLKELEQKKGQTVEQGDVVGHVGKTGNVNSPQLHFGIRKGREPVDPKNYL